MPPFRRQTPSSVEHAQDLLHQVTGQQVPRQREPAILVGWTAQPSAFMQAAAIASMSNMCFFDRPANNKMRELYDIARNLLRSLRGRVTSTAFLPFVVLVLGAGK